MTAVDEAFLPLPDLVPALLPQLPDLVAAVDEETGVRTRVSAYDVTSPVELDISVGPDGSVQIGGAPPLYHLDTSTRPVLHGLRVLAVRDGLDDEGWDDESGDDESGDDESGDDS